MLFKKGHIPWNKGTKGVCRVNSGSFKEGHKMPKGKNSPMYEIGKKRKGKNNPNWKGGLTKNKEHNRKVARENARKYRKKYQYRLNEIIANAIYVSLKGNKAGRKWESLVGYTLQDLVKHLENLFDDKMNWSNYSSYWEIDHKRPKSWFNYKTAEDSGFKKCWTLSNLQPLEVSQNRSKKNHYEKIT